MRRTIDFTAVRGVLVALIGMLLVLAAPALAEARGATHDTQGGSNLLASGTGYGSPQGSERVRAVQHRLLRAGERPGPIDGRYGPLTEAAVEHFQAGEGLAVDGIVGPATANALSRQTVVVWNGAGYSKLQGSTRVRGLQHRLRRAGERPGPLDGRFGPVTEAAVERFQAGEGLAVDGVVGPATSGRLARFAAASAQTSGTHADRADRSPAESRHAPKPLSTPDHAGHLAPSHAATPATDRDRHGSGLAAWFVGLAFAVALLFGGVLVLALARRTRPKEPDPQETEAEPSFKVRFHGRNGQGVMTAAELLSVAALVEGRDALAFPSFRPGPEGPRVVAFCRIGGRPIRPRESIGRPDGLIVQDPEAPQLSDLCEGLQPGGYLLVNSTSSVDELDLGEFVATLQLDRRLSMPASEIGREHIGLPMPDAALVGGFAALSGCVSLESVASSIRERFPGQTGDGDVAAAEAGFRYVQAEVRGLARWKHVEQPAVLERVNGIRGAA